LSKIVAIFELPISIAQSNLFFAILIPLNIQELVG